MPSVVIDRLPHTCHTKKGLVVYSDDNNRVTGYCWSCGTYVEDPYEGLEKKDLPKRVVKSPEQVAQELAEISGYQFLDIPERRLRKESFEKFGVRVAVSEKDGKTPQAMYFPLTKGGKVTGYQVKTVGMGEHNKVFMVGDAKDVDLIGWEIAKKSGAYRLIITEGPCDMVAVDRIHEMHGKPEFAPAVVSIPYGAAKARDSVLKHVKEIRALFKEVYLCFDNDGPGQDAVSKTMLVLPEAKSITLPCKDANDCLIQGKAKAAYTAISFMAAKPPNTRILSGADVHLSAKEPAKFGELTWPWPQMNDDLRGVRLGETIYIGAGVKLGKSVVKSVLGAHFMTEGHKIFVAAFEETNNTTYRLLAGQIAGKIFHDPKVPFDEEAFDFAGEVMKDKLSLLNVYQSADWNTLKTDIVEATSKGAKVVFIDPITSLTNGVNSADANTMLGAFAQELAAMAMDLKFTAFLFCHLKASEGGLTEEKRKSYYAKQQYLDLGPIPHELGGSVSSNQFTGSRAMMRSCNLMLGLLGNKDPNLPEEVRNIREIRVLEDRNLGVSAKYPLFYNKNTGRLIAL